MAVVSEVIGGDWSVIATKVIVVGAVLHLNRVVGIIKMKVRRSRYSTHRMGSYT